MAFEHIFFDDRGQFGSTARATLTKMEQADAEIIRLWQVMVDMRDGADNPADTSNYAEVVKRYGFGDWQPVQGDPTSEQCTLARKGWLEVNEAYLATQNAKPARDHLYKLLRG